MIRFTYTRTSDDQPRAHVGITFSLGIDSLEYAGFIVAYEAYLDGQDPLHVARRLSKSRVEEEVRNQLRQNGYGEWSPIDVGVFESEMHYDAVEVAVRKRVCQLWPEGVQS